MMNLAIPKPPLLPSRYLNDSGIESMDRVVSSYTQMINMDLEGLPGRTNRFKIDEVAVYFPNQAEAWDFIQTAEQEGFAKRFNVAVDVVRTWPIRREYSVQYHFLRGMGGHERAYRIEVMYLTSGSSPLHSTLDPNFDGRGRLIHASFKVSSGVEMQQVRQSLNAGGGHGFFEAMGCQSRYGEFYYYGQGSLTSDGVYLKPRLNLRDDPPTPSSPQEGGQ